MALGVPGHKEVDQLGCDCLCLGDVHPLPACQVWQGGSETRKQVTDCGGSNSWAGMQEGLQGAGAGQQGRRVGTCILACSGVGATHAPPSIRFFWRRQFCASSGHSSCACTIPRSCSGQGRQGGGSACSPADLRDGPCSPSKVVACCRGCQQTKRTRWLAPQLADAWADRRRPGPLTASTLMLEKISCRFQRARRRQSFS